MAVRKGREPSAGLEAVAVFATLDVNKGQTTVSDVQRRHAVIEQFSKGLDESLSLDSRLHGLRVQHMFESLVVALGKFKVIKTEAVGSFYFDEAEGEIALPDFRLVTSEDEQLLVEVKNVSPSSQAETSVRSKDLLRLRLYASLTGARLVYAFYWSAINAWTLVDSSALLGETPNQRLSFLRAMKLNEMSRLGDAIIGIRAPLAMRIVADTEPARSYSGESPGDDALVGFTINEVEYYSQEVLIEDSIERKLANFLIFYGRWDTEDFVELDANGLPNAMQLVAKPDLEADTQDSQGFSFIGSLSSMYATAFNVKTLDSELNITGLTDRAKPELLAELIPADYWERESRVLSVWRISLTASDS